MQEKSRRLASGGVRSPQKPHSLRPITADPQTIAVLPGGEKDTARLDVTEFEKMLFLGQIANDQ